MHGKDQRRLQFINIQKQSHVKPSKMHKKLHVSFKHSFKWTKKSGIYLFGRNLSFFFPFTLTFAITASRVQHHIKEQSQGTVKSKETRRLLLKSTKRTREFYGRNIVKWFSSMPHNIVLLIVHLNSLLLLEIIVSVILFLSSFQKKIFFPILCTFNY